MSHYLKASGKLAGKSIYLRLPGPDDLGFVRRLWLDRETMAAVGGPVEASLESLQAWYARMVDPGRPTDLYCLVCELRSGEPVGEASFHRLDQAKMSAYLNIKVAYASRGLGYGRDTLAVFLGFFFEMIGGREMLDDVRLENDAGRRLLEQNGFQRDAGRNDIVLLRMTRGRFFEVHGKYRG